MRKSLNNSFKIFSTILLPMLISFILILVLNIGLTPIFGSNVAVTINIHPTNAFDDIKYIVPALVISTALITKVINVSINSNSKTIDFDVVVSSNTYLSHINKRLEFIEDVKVNYLRI